MITRYEGTENSVDIIQPKLTQLTAFPSSLSAKSSWIKLFLSQLWFSQKRKSNTKQWFYWNWGIEKKRFNYSTQPLPPHTQILQSGCSLLNQETNYKLISILATLHPSLELHDIWWLVYRNWSQATLSIKYIYDIPPILCVICDT